MDESIESKEMNSLNQYKNLIKKEGHHNKNKISLYQLEQNRMDSVSGFPKNLAFTLKQLSIFTKQTVNVMPDRSNDVNLGDVSRFKLPASAMIDFRTILIFADVTLFNINTAETGYALHLPRNTSSLIQQMTITCNVVM